MNLLTRPYDYSTVQGTDLLAVKMYNDPARWFATVFLQVTLGAWLVLMPASALEIIQVPYSPSMAALFQLYGAILLSRGLLEQYVRNRLELELIYALTLSSLPFEIISASVFAYASYTGILNPWVGWILTPLFLISATQHGNVAIRHLLQKKNFATGISPA